MILRRRLALAALATLVGLALLPTAASASARPFLGTGTWVDIFDSGYHDSPLRTVNAAAAHGLKTIYVETGNSSQPVAVVHPLALRRLVALAHAHHIRVVTWYLPTLTNPARDLRRLRAAAAVGAPGTVVDGVAIDIESDAVGNSTLRSKRVVWLAQQLRSALPHRPIGAIIPAPPGMALHASYWPKFPYAGLAAVTDAFLPMCYASYRSGQSPAATRRYGRACVTGVRTGTANPSEVVHVIGGITQDLGWARSRSLVLGARDAGAQGFSFYGLPGMRPDQWHSLGLCGC